MNHIKLIKACFLTEKIFIQVFKTYLTTIKVYKQNIMFKMLKKKINNLILT